MLFRSKGLNAFKALKEVAGDLSREKVTEAKVAERNMLLNLAVRVDAERIAKGAPTVADAILAREIGSMKRFAGSLDAADYKGRMLAKKITTAMQAKLEAAGIWHDVRKGLLDGELWKVWDGIEGADPRAKKFIEIYEDRKSTRLNSSHVSESRMPSSA